MTSSKSFDGFGRDEVVSELELESLLLDERVGERDADIDSHISSKFRRSKHARNWGRKLRIPVARKSIGVPICRTARRQNCTRRGLRYLIFILAVAAGTYIGLFVFTVLPWLSPDPFDDAFEPFRQHSDRISVDSPYYPTHYIQSVLPVASFNPCHSHNDYWRRTPLYAALGSGCISVEADVWYFENDRREPELFVGHTTATLSDNATLRTMYIDPLITVIERMNAPNKIAGPSATPHGVFYQDPDQALTLLIDFKTDGVDTFLQVQEQLAPLRGRGWLTTWNGTTRTEGLVTIVATGNAPFDLLVANTTYRDIFYDAPLDALEDASDRDPQPGDPHGFSPYGFKYNPSNSHLASAPFIRALGVNKVTFSAPHIWGPPLSEEQALIIRQQISNARTRGLVPRYWGTPRWPRALRDRVWEVLYDEGIGLLNVDDLRAARKGHWGGK
ncbi:uncharacterized protein BDZ99DRAFT_483632 [Mytilinidion resinicola]|uniref:Altered inheritance of mitochondria protein 6 n=1 Tax=Mytilinidion resinicola TaxID=574789 RepID=A0A6A6Y061_9PEZI|nr:uncharacterized protein BDZ99DRAFT_483632 [Mytilinidion resinicola]KAF2801605.1 hypothetical protein BDZ99DRAFT_483632 [Mytilinidion resinicola]